MMFVETKLPNEWVWDEYPTGERLELLLNLYNAWLEIKYIGELLHDFDEYYMCDPITWRICPINSNMPIEEVKDWLDAVIKEELKFARNDLKESNLKESNLKKSN